MTVVRDGAGGVAARIPDEQIHGLMVEAMRSIGAVAKDERNKSQGFNFRGIDTVINTLGPVLRDKGIFLLPLAGEPVVQRYETKGGTAMTHVLLPVTVRFVAADGSYVECRAMGEAADAGDKVASKAHSVALRIALLQVFAIPTDEADPDSESHERAAEPTGPPAEDVGDRGWESVDELESGWEDLKAMCAQPGESGEWAKSWAAALDVTKGNLSAAFMAEMYVAMANAKKDGDWKANYTPPEVP